MLACLVNVRVVLLVATCTTSLQPEPNAYSKTQQTGQSVGCCCGIGSFLPQLLIENAETLSLNMLAEYIRHIKYYYKNRLYARHQTKL